MRAASLTADGHLAHSCTVCGRAASFGFGVRLLKDRLGTWYCAAHRPAAIAPEPPATPPANTRSAKPSKAAAGQGTLF